MDGVVQAPGLQGPLALIREELRKISYGCLHANALAL